MVDVGAISYLKMISWCCPTYPGEPFDEAVGFDPPDSVSVRDRRLQAMYMQHQRLLQKQKDRVASGESDSHSKIEALTQGVFYIQAAASALGRPLVGEVGTNRVSQPTEGAWSNDADGPILRVDGGPRRHTSDFIGPSSAGARLGSEIAVEGMAWSAPHGRMIHNNRGGLRRALVGAQAMQAHQITEGGGSMIAAMRSARQFTATGNAESYTYDTASDMMGTDFGFAIQRPGMVHFSPQQQSFAGYMGQHHPASYGDPYMMHQLGGRSHMVNGTSPHASGMMVGSGRSWGAHQFGGAGGANFAMRSPASVQQYMGMPPPPPPPQAVSSPWGFAGHQQGVAEEESGNDRRSTPTTNASVPRSIAGGDASGFAQFSSPPLEPPHPNNTTSLENALAEWDPFFGSFEEELGTSSGGGGGGGGGGGQAPDYSSPSTHAKHSRQGPGGSGGSGGKKDYSFANSPKQVCRTLHRHCYMDGWSWLTHIVLVWSFDDAA